MKWKCHIPGKPKTDWEGGYFPLTIEFSEDYPSKPPKVREFPGLQTAHHLCASLETCSGDTERACCLSAVQVCAELLPPKHLPLWHSVLEHFERGELHDPFIACHLTF